MGIINLADVQPGMVLDADVQDLNGRVFLSAGGVITEKHIRIFKMWGITEANIRGVAKEDVAHLVTEQFDPVMLQEAEREGRELFRHTDLKHPFMEELFRLFMWQTLRQRAGKDEDDQSAE